MDLRNLCDIFQVWEIKLSKSCSSVKDKSAATVEFLSTLNRHSKAVNVVRFSHDGEFETVQILLLVVIVQ